MKKQNSHKTGSSEGARTKKLREGEAPCSEKSVEGAGFREGDRRPGPNNPTPLGDQTKRPVSKKTEVFVVRKKEHWEGTS